MIAVGWLVAIAAAGEIVDAAGVTVRAEPADRVVVLSGGLTESVFALGAGERVVAVDTTSVYPDEVGKLPHLGYYRALAAEPLLATGADLVILPDNAGPPEVLAQVQAAGLDVVTLPSASGVDAARVRLRMLGDLLDRADRAEALVSALDTALAKARPAPGPRVMFVYAASGGTLQIAGQDTAADEMIRLAGGKNAAQGWTSYRPLTAEAVVAARPDVLLVSDRGLGLMGGVEGLLAAPGVALTPAGRARRVHAMDELFLLGFGPRTGDAVVALSERLSAP